MIGVLSNIILFFSFLSNTYAYNWTKYHSNNELASILIEVHEKCKNISFFYHLETSETDTTSGGNKLYVLAFGQPADRHKAGEVKLI